MKTIEQKYQDWLCENKEDLHKWVDEKERCFECGYQLAKSEYEAKLKEAVEVIELMFDDLKNEGIDHYDGGKAYQALLKSQSEISK